MDNKQFMKKAGLWGLCVAAAVFFCGGRLEAGSSLRLGGEAGKILRLDTDNVEVDMGGLSEGEEFQAAQARLASVDMEQACSYFLKDWKTEVPEVYENYSDPEGEQAPIAVYEDEGNSFAVSENDFYFVGQEAHYIWNAFYPDRATDEYNAELYSVDADLNFMSRKAAWEQLKEELQKAGVDMSHAVSRITYSLDWETLQQEESCVDVNGSVCEEELKPGWSEEDEGYHYYITQSWEGIPIYNGAYVNQDEKTEAPMEIYQTREGIRYARMDRWFQIEPGDKSFRLAAFEDVMDTLEIVLEKRCSAEREGNPLTVEKAALYLFAVETDVEGLYDLEPVWVCTLAEERADLGERAYTSRFCVPIHAVTAEEMEEVEI